MIRIVTDSSCDLPDDLLARHRISLVPLTIRFGDEEFVDREELSVDGFWQRLTGGEVLPETAAPSVGRFQETFTRLNAGGADGIVVVCISSRISATHQAAVLAAEQFPGVHRFLLHKWYFDELYSAVVVRPGVITRLEKAVSMIPHTISIMRS